MNIHERFNQIIEAVEAETGVIFVTEERGSMERPVQFTKTEVCDCEFSLECDGFSIHAFSEDFTSEEKNSMTLGHDGADDKAIADFLVQGIQGASPALSMGMS